MNEIALINAAKEASKMAYAPYSSFRVGAALLASNGTIFSGCNVENVSFGLTICAERSAICTAVAAGQHSFAAMAIFADSKELIVPCGACRQVLAEFAPDLVVITSNTTGNSETLALNTLLPHPSRGILEWNRST